MGRSVFAVACTVAALAATAATTPAAPPTLTAKKSEGAPVNTVTAAASKIPKSKSKSKMIVFLPSKDGTRPKDRLVVAVSHAQSKNEVHAATTTTASTADVAVTTAAPTPAPPRPCETPFGTVVGTALGVPAYSNCNDYFTSDKDSFYNATDASGATVSVYVGLQWQCVEYARRSLFIHTGFVFPSVDGAVDIWDVTTLSAPLQPGVTAPLTKFKNGAATSTSLPAPKCLLIYPVQTWPTELPFGHVSVVTKVEVLPFGFFARVFIAEENWSSEMWPQANYSRVLPAIRGFNGGWNVIDSLNRINGWMCGPTTN